MAANGTTQLGGDLRQLLVRWVAGWGELSEWLARRGWLPVTRVNLIGSEGVTCVSTPGFLPCKQESAGKADQAFWALTVPEDYTLVRKLSFPLMAPELLNNALSLQVEALSPFSAEDTLWGTYQESGSSDQLTVWLVITAKSLLDKVLEKARLEHPALPESFEFWAAAGASHAVIRGFGEKRRESFLRKQGRVRWALYGVVGVLLCALLLTPLLQQRFFAIQAQTALGELSGRTGAAIKLREELVRLESVRGVLAPKLDNEQDSFKVLDRIAAILPDDAWLDGYEYKPGFVRLSGRAGNATTLLAALQEERLFNNVRSASPTVRDARSGKERFVIELELVP